MLVNRNEGVNDGVNEIKSMKETKRYERNKADNRARWNKNKVKREEKKDDNLEKIDLKEIYSQLLQEEHIFSRRGYIFNTRQRISIVSEELQNGNVSSNIDSTTRHLTACTSQEKAVPFESQQTRYGVSSERRLEEYFVQTQHSFQLKSECFD